MKPLSRRAVLRGAAGAALALPFLDAMRPARSADGAAPTRLLLLYRPHGCIPADWVPSGEGDAWTASRVLAPLDRHRDRVLVVSGMDNVPPERFRGFEMPHDFATMGLLSGEDHYASRPDSPHAGRSFDHLVAPTLQGSAPLSALHLGSEGTVPCAGTCIYNKTVFYSGLGQPILPLIHPAAAWQAALGIPAELETPEQRSLRLSDRLAIVDRVAASSADLSRRLGAADRRRMDRWLTDLRTLERETEAQLGTPPCSGDQDIWSLWGTDLADAEYNTRFMLELTLLALQCDRARTIGYMFGVESSARVLPRLGSWATSHYLSHHKGVPAAIEAVNAVHTWEHEQVAWLLDRLAELPGEDGGSLLDCTLVVLMSGMGDPDIHQLTELPIVLAGGGGRYFDPGRHVRRTGQPAQDLFSALAEALGTPIGPLGMTGTGVFSGLRR